MQLAKASVAADLERLNSYLPLAARQARLPAATRAVHRNILRFLYEKARAPVLADFGDTLPVLPDLHACLQALASEDLLVLDKHTGMPLGAYPITSEQTPHLLTINNRHIYAMCALDAVSVGPMFGGEVKITSSCQHTATPILIRMRGKEILEVLPDANCTIAIRWRSPGTVAAYSICMQMVFLRDEAAAAAWRKNDDEGVSLLSLRDAVAVGSEFFCPLLPHGG
jgi:hypothetical protein